MNYLSKKQTTKHYTSVNAKDQFDLSLAIYMEHYGAPL